MKAGAKFWKPDELIALWGDNPPDRMTPGWVSATDYQALLRESSEAVARLTTTLEEERALRRWALAE